MKSNKSSFLSLQKQISNNDMLDTEMQRCFDDLKITRLLNKSGIRKVKGYPTKYLIFFYTLLPFIKRGLTQFVTKELLDSENRARKDTYYRFLNCERFNWRKFIYFVAMRIVALFDTTDYSDKVLIADDTIIPKTGKKMEGVSYHFCHKLNRSVLGFACLQLGYHNGLHFMPLDFTIHQSSKTCNNRIRDIDKRTNGWKRRKESLKKKTDALIEMLARAYNQGIDVPVVLFDSWFAHASVISKIYDIGYNTICRLKNNKVKYGYNGQQHTLKQLWQLVRKHCKRIDKYGSQRGCHLDVYLPKHGIVRILFVRESKKQFCAILSTDTDLQASEITNYYARRWAIEVFFKDAKQMLCLGKEQSNIFDAHISCYSIVMLRYLMLILILYRNTTKAKTTIGVIFREIQEEQTILEYSRAVWNLLKQFILKSRDVFYNKISEKKLFQLIDFIDNSLPSYEQILCAKL